MPTIKQAEHWDCLTWPATQREPIIWISLGQLEKLVECRTRRRSEEGGVPMVVIVGETRMREPRAPGPEIDPRRHWKYCKHGKSMNLLHFSSPGRVSKPR
jgi:hypothetical protein